ncbi:MAG TPA: hypothetical protein VMF52_00530 [Steroidobacteraceae bacterium]|nr:hypothetical protein [Steroidobacteraceae bacterium]
MPPSAKSGPVFLNAIVVEDRVPQFRVGELTHVNLVSLLAKRVAALTWGARTTASSSWLWNAMVAKPELFDPLLNVPSHASRWMLFRKDFTGGGFQFETMVEDIDRLSPQPNGLLSLGTSHLDESSLLTLVPATEWKKSDADRIRGYLDIAFDDHVPLAIEVKRATPLKDAVAADRAALIAARREMLESVGWFSSQDLASAATSTTSNASQLAADLRKPGRVLGVRFGQSWCYPKFQFDGRKQIIPEMKQVLAALSPDDQGWDRLQWFLEPNETLKGRPPVDVWETDRARVVDAASKERWNGRD